MRKVFIDVLPKLGTHNVKTDWNKSIGCKVNFIYDDIIGQIKIINYKDNIITIQYNDITHKLRRDHFIHCMFGGFIKNKVIHKYDINEIISSSHGDIKILKQTKIKLNGKNKGKQCKAYLCQCLNDNYIWEINEFELSKGIGCPICANKKVIKGINDMWTTNPEQAKLLANPEDGYKYTQCSGQKVNWECPECGNIIKNRAINQIYKQRLSCPRCNDGISYPEKLMYNLLQQLNINFNYQQRFNWCIYKLKDKQKYGIYDFYFELDNKKYIVETDGGWHNEDNELSGQTATESKFIDNIKDTLAKEHGMEVIRIDCQTSELNYIKNNITNSQISNIFNLRKIDWVQIDQASQKSLIKNVCDLKKQNDYRVGELCNIFKLGHSTIQSYLVKGTKLGWCHYDPKEEQHKAGYAVSHYNIKRQRKTICVTTNLIYNSTAEAAKKTNVGSGHISDCCSNKRKSAGKLTDGTPLRWMYLEDFINQKLDSDAS